MFLEIFCIFLISAVEGITEFFPVSSTAHILILSQILDIKLGMEFVVGIQLGAILAVFSLYRKYVKIIFVEICTMKFCILFTLFFITMPTLFVGFILHEAGYLSLFHSHTMQFTLIFGGILMLIFRKKTGSIEDISQISKMTALKIGLIQSISLIPGVSRSASVVFGGIFSGLSRAAAIELSFLSGVPIIFCASVFEFWNGYSEGTNIQSFPTLIFSMVVAFVFAYLGIKIMKMLTKSGRDFEIFGVYRIIMGVVLLCMM